jgi:uncharacterized protein YbbC (DUF1343 family)
MKANLTVIRMQGWQRNMWYDETGLEFIKPSPNIPDLTTAALYPGLCLIEGINVSEGRGTQTPFKIFGAPWIDSDKLIKSLNDLNLPGLGFKSKQFTPVSIPGMSTNPKYKDQSCNGAEIVIRDRDSLDIFYSGVKIVETLYNLYPDSLEFRSGHFDRLCGTDNIRKAIMDRISDDKLKKLTEAGVAEFKKMTKPYLLY